MQSSRFITPKSNRIKKAKREAQLSGISFDSNGIKGMASVFFLDEVISQTKYLLKVENDRVALTPLQLDAKENRIRLYNLSIEHLSDAASLGHDLVIDGEGKILVKCINEKAFTKAVVSSNNAQVLSELATSIYNSMIEKRIELEKITVSKEEYIAQIKRKLEVARELNIIKDEKVNESVKIESVNKVSNDNQNIENKQNKLNN